MAQFQQTLMILPTSTFVTYQAAGNREDLSDMIYRIDPVDTPFMSGAEKEKATAVNHEWQTQALAAPSAANAQLEGDDPTTTPATPTVHRLTFLKSAPMPAFDRGHWWLAFHKGPMPRTPDTSAGLAYWKNTGQGIATAPDAGC